MPPKPSTLPPKTLNAILVADDANTLALVLGFPDIYWSLGFPDIYILAKSAASPTRLREDSSALFVVEDSSSSSWAFLFFPRPGGV